MIGLAMMLVAIFGPSTVLGVGDQRVMEATMKAARSCGIDTYSRVSRPSDVLPGSSPSPGSLTVLSAQTVTPKQMECFLPKAAEALKTTD